VRIGTFAGAAGGNAVNGVTKTGPSVALTQYGEVVDVTAIVDAGDRTGVDTVWGPEALYGHFGLDLVGPNWVFWIGDLDITSYFLCDMLALSMCAILPPLAMRPKPSSAPSRLC